MTNRTTPIAANVDRANTKKVFVKTYGCQMNVYDSQRMADALGKQGFVETQSPEEADMVLLNTCHIREKAAEKVYSEIGRLRKQRERRRENGKDLMIGVAGCVAQAEGDEIVRRAPMVITRQPSLQSLFAHVPPQRKRFVGGNHKRQIRRPIFC